MESKSHSSTVFFTKLVIVLIFFGAIFFIGWSQFKVSTNEVGFINSKTSGFCNDPIESGKFSWHWEYLLPTNVTMMKFSLGAKSYTRVISGVLPSSEVFSTVFDKSDPPVNVDFSYEVKIDVSCFVSQENILRLVKDRVIDGDEALAAFIEDGVNQYVTQLGNAVVKKAFEIEKNTGLFFDGDLNVDAIIKGLSFDEKLPYITITKTVVHDVKMPSFSLYQAARKKYFESSNFLDEIKSSAQ